LSPNLQARDSRSRKRSDYWDKRGNRAGIELGKGEGSNSWTLDENSTTNQIRIIDPAGAEDSAGDGGYRIPPSPPSSRRPSVTVTLNSRVSFQVPPWLTVT